MTMYIHADDLVNEINLNDLLFASVNDAGEIEIEYLGKCGNELVADCIERVYESDWLKWVRSSEADNIATYKLTADIFEPCEGGIAVFDTYTDRDTWLNQI